MSEGDRNYGRHLNELQRGLFSTLGQLEEIAYSPERSKVYSSIEDVRRLLLSVAGDFADTEKRIGQMKELIAGLKGDVDAVKEKYFMDYFSDSYDEMFEWLSRSYLSEDHRQMVLPGIGSAVPEYPSKDKIIKEWKKIDREKRVSVLSCFKRPEIVIVPNHAAWKILEDIVRYNETDDFSVEAGKCDFPFVECLGPNSLNNVRELMKAVNNGPPFTVDIVDSAPASMELIDPCLTHDEKGNQLNLDVLYRLYSNYFKIQGLEPIGLLSYLLLAGKNIKGHEGFYKNKLQQLLSKGEEKGNAERDARHYADALYLDQEAHIVLNSDLWSGKDYLVGFWDVEDCLDLNVVGERGDAEVAENAVFRPAYRLM